MNKLIVQHFRGPKALYNVTSHGQGIYFATDTKEIILNGEPYSGEGSESFSALQAQVQENTDALVVLNGTGEGSVIKTVNDAINDFATKVSDNGVVDNFKEVLDYVATHGGEFSELVVDVDGVKQKNVEQDARLDAIELVLGSSEEGAPTLVETVSQLTTDVDQLESDMDNVESQVGTNSSDIQNLQNLVGTTSVATQIDEALDWEEVV